MGCGSIPVIGPILDPPKPKISFPGPSAAEQQLQQAQTTNVEMNTKLLQDQLEEAKKTRELWDQFLPTTPEEIAAYRESQKQEQRLNKMLSDRLEAQLTSGATELEKLNEQVGIAGAKRTLQALEGKLPIDAGTQQRKAEEFKALQEGLSRTGNLITGDTPETAIANTTAGQQALLSFNKKWGALEDAQRFGQIDSGTSQLLSQMGLMQSRQAQNYAEQGGYRGLGERAVANIANKGSYGWAPLQAGYASLGSLYNAAIEPYQWNRSASYTGKLQTKKNQFDLYGQSMGLLTTMAGAAAGKWLPSGSSSGSTNILNGIGTNYEPSGGRASTGIRY